VQVTVSEGTVKVRVNSRPTLVISDAAVAEGNSGMTPFVFTITLSSPSSTAVTVQYATQNQTAIAGSDYVAVPPTTITFNPGETTKTVTINVIGDTAKESNELFAVNLLNPVGATLGTSRGFGNIINDD